ncbi:MAG: hypothetical protein ABIZ50_05365, partial [Solirubrobacterales bacterium]
GDTRVRHDVQSLDFLPDDKHPVVQYVEGDPEGETAAFVVAADAAVAEGDAKCAPSKGNCRFLLMKVGDDQTFRYGLEGTLYRVQLLDIDRHIVPLEHAATPSGAKRAVPPGWETNTGTSTVTGYSRP